MNFLNSESDTSITFSTAHFCGLKPLDLQIIFAFKISLLIIEDAPFSVKVFKFFGHDVLLKVNGEERLYILAAISPSGKSILVQGLFDPVQIRKYFLIFKSADTHYKQKFSRRCGHCLNMIKVLRVLFEQLSHCGIFLFFRECF